MNKCENCREKHEGKYGSGRFCSSKCARSFSAKVNREETNNKISLTLTKEPYTNICKECNNEFKTKRKYIKYCTRNCASLNHAKSEKGKETSRLGGIASAQLQSETRRSKNEKAFAELCIEYFKEVECNKGIFNGWDADVIIHDLKVAVLWNGKWHYEKCNKKHSVLQVQNRDKIKTKEIIKYGYTPYIIKDLGKFDLNKVNLEWNNFLKIYGAIVQW